MTSESSATNPAYELTIQAVKNNELDKLLLGIEPYVFLPKWSPSPTNTDLTYIYSHGICEYAKRHPDKKFLSLLKETLNDLGRRYEGIVPIASVIYMEASGNSKGNISPLGIDLQKLAMVIKNTINENAERLLMDNGPLGKGRKHGLLSYLEYLNKTIIEYGGPEIL